MGVGCFNGRWRWRSNVFVFFGFLVLVYLGLYRQASIEYDKLRDKSNFKRYVPRETTSSNKTIPKIIHQIWSDEILPDQFVKYVQSLVKYNSYPEWEYFFWTLGIGGEFIRQHYPTLDTMYQRAAKITKSEILRTVLIYHYGGVYLDLDVVGVRPLDRFVENHECSLVGPIPVFFVAYDLKLDYRNLNSAIYLCRAGHPFFKLHIEETGMRSQACLPNQECPPPEFPFPLLVTLTDKGDNDTVPEIANYELFDSKYDTVVTGLLEKRCYGDNYKTLERAKQVICDDWKAYGKEDRKVPENAYTFHTWYHTRARKITSDPKNLVWNIVPHVKIYNSELRGHYGNIIPV